ncbi:hypothetical protein K4G92_24510, partial [Mycobacterium tuberculosis]|nr:hypothetical protein [Mycobacterium tuberculosis]
LRPRLAWGGSVGVPTPHMPVQRRARTRPRAATSPEQSATIEEHHDPGTHVFPPPGALGPADLVA